VIFGVPTKSERILACRMLLIELVKGIIFDMPGLNNISEDGLLRTSDGSRCEPRVEYHGYPRVVDWGMPDDVHAGDFTFSVINTALAVGATDIQLTPIDEAGVVSVHFRIGSEYIRQAPLTGIQFGFIAILLAHIATPSVFESESYEGTSFFTDKDGAPYYARFSKFKLSDNRTSVLIRLLPAPQRIQSAA
jgi:hypothetical protein